MIISPVLVFVHLLVMPVSCFVSKADGGAFRSPGIHNDKAHLRQLVSIAPYCGFPEDMNPDLCGQMVICSLNAKNKLDCDTLGYFTASPCRWENDACSWGTTGEDRLFPLPQSKTFVSSWHFTYLWMHLVKASNFLSLWNIYCFSLWSTYCLSIYH